jgi:hypothetical protein
MTDAEKVTLLRSVGLALIQDVKGRHPGEPLTCPFMRALDDALRATEPPDDSDYWHPGSGRLTGKPVSVRTPSFPTGTIPPPNAGNAPSGKEETFSGACSSNACPYTFQGRARPTLVCPWCSAEVYAVSSLPRAPTTAGEAEKCFCGRDGCGLCHPTNDRTKP